MNCCTEDRDEDEEEDDEEGVDEDLASFKTVTLGDMSLFYFSG